MNHTTRVARPPKRLPAADATPMGEQWASRGRAEELHWTSSGASREQLRRPSDSRGIPLLWPIVCGSSPAARPGQLGALSAANWPPETLSGGRSLGRTLFLSNGRRNPT